MISCSYERISVLKSSRILREVEMQPLYRAARKLSVRRIEAGEEFRLSLSLLRGSIRLRLFLADRAHVRGILFYVFWLPNVHYTACAGGVGI
jgi:hypothetical protein